MGMAQWPRKTAQLNRDAAAAHNGRIASLSASGKPEALPAGSVVPSEIVILPQPTPYPNPAGPLHQVPSLQWPKTRRGGSKHRLGLCGPAVHLLVPASLVALLPWHSQPRGALAR
jgi:hypothetical protein